MTENFNLFEPSLDITTPYLPYEDLGIQGVWPRNHKIPTDIFPTFAHIGGTNVEKTKVHTASFTDDRRLRVDTGSSGGGSTSSTGYGAVNTWVGWASATSYTSDQRIDIHTRFSTMWKLTLISSLDTSSCSMNQPVLVRVYFLGKPSGFYFEYEAFIHVQRPAGASINVCDVQQKTITFPGGWSNLPFFDTNDTRVEVHFQSDEGFLPLVYASIDFS